MIRERRDIQIERKETNDERQRERKKRREREGKEER